MMKLGSEKRMPNPFSALKLVFSSILAVVFILAVLFVPAGTLNWPEGWLFVAMFFVYAVLVGGWLKKNSPKLAEKRVSLRVPEKGWDRAIMGLLGVFIVVLFVVAGLDAMRFRLTQLPLALEAIGFVGFALGLYLNFLAMKENAFASRIVELQKGQRVVKTGVYAKIRHPMYAAFILMFAS